MIWCINIGSSWPSDSIWLIAYLRITVMICIPPVVGLGCVCIVHSTCYWMSWGRVLVAYISALTSWCCREMWGGKAESSKWYANHFNSSQFTPQWRVHVMCFKQFHKMRYKKKNANHRNHPESIPSPLLHHRFLAFELVSLKLKFLQPAGRIGVGPVSD